MPDIKSQNNDTDRPLENSAGSDIAGHDPSQSWVASIIEWSVRNKIFVLIGALALLVFGMRSVEQIPLDAIPDLSDPQVIVRAEFPGQAPQIIEDQVTYPLSSTMLSLPNVDTVRGFSMFGTSFVYIIFDEGTDLYWARSRVLEALSQASDDLPNSVTPQLGPDATGVGWIYQYALVDNSGDNDLAELRTLQDWFLKFELETVDGVAEVASVGGFVIEYQVFINPNKLQGYGLSLARVRRAIQSSNQEVGGRLIEQAETEYMIRSRGYITNLEDLNQIVIHAHNGMAVQLSDVARIVKGPELRRGVTDFNGQGDTAAGIVIMRPGYNALNVIDDVKEKLASLKNGLPKTVEIVPVYDRSQLIENSVDNLTKKLLAESIVVAIVIFLFLLHLRASMVAILTLPLGVLAAFIVMEAQGITANIMSLGGIAIAIGAMVDAAIVMVENAHRKLAELQKTQKTDNLSLGDRRRAVINAAKEVGPGIFFSLLIITVSFLPVFALTGQAGRLFSPLAFTKTYAMAGASILAVTLIPVLMVIFLKGRFYGEDKNPINHFFKMLYEPILKWSLNWPKTIMVLAVIGLCSTAWPIHKLGQEFMPELNEGDLLYMPTTLPGVSISTARQILQTTNELILSIPEVEKTWGKAGRADTATDPAPLSMIETWITLRPKSQWRNGMTIDKLQNELNETVQLPGLVNSWGYPIKIRLDMLTTGIRTPVGIKIAGENLQALEEIGASVESVMRGMDGTRSVFADRVTGGRYLTITPNRRSLARHGITLFQFQSVITSALGGKAISQTVEGRQRYNIALRYDRANRSAMGDIKNILVAGSNGAHLPLSQLAEIRYENGPPMIKSENARLNTWVFVDVTTSDIAGFVDQAKQVVRDNVDLPTGYSLTWSGQFEQIQAANERLSIAIPSAVFVILLLLYLHFGRWDRTAMVLTALPFSVVGGFWALHMMNYNLSVAAGVGFIALAGVAVETAVIMLIYLDQAVRDQRPSTIDQLRSAVMDGALLRLRPKLMTVLTVILGLLPIFITTGTGSDVMRRIALPMVGGMITTMIMTLILIPVIYEEYLKRSLNSTQNKGDR